jgi:formylglycine-generating enzyme required for sulfatase activity
MRSAAAYGHAQRSSTSTGDLTIMKTTGLVLLGYLILTVISFAQPVSGYAPSAATKEHPFVNSLGMKFVPVPGTGVLFCIHETRKGDYRRFMDATTGLDPSVRYNKGLDYTWENSVHVVLWDKFQVSEGEDHPVVNVNWDEAKIFCAWLTGKEKLTYRLPTDHEWSCAVRIADREDRNATPASKSGKLAGEYPWGTAWPPPKGAGNFADITMKAKIAKEPAIEGYEDGFVTTAPVMSFLPNTFGLYDMAGNVWQWCEDRFDSQGVDRVLRGGSWVDCYSNQFLSSTRSRSPVDSHEVYYGFRCVLVLNSST